MASDWIKMRVALSYDLKVMQMARSINGNDLFLDDLAPHGQLTCGACNTKLLQLLVVGALHKFWCACQEFTTDGNLRDLTDGDIDCLVGVFGFTDAMIDVGWINKVDDGSLQVPGWHEHNGEGAKKRAETAKRVSKHRDLKRKSVTKALPEKSREEVSNTKSVSIKKFIPPSLDEVKAYCAEINCGIDPVQFWNYYETNGWRTNKGQMKDWRAGVRYWSSNGHGRNGQTQRSIPQLEIIKRI